MHTIEGVAFISAPALIVTVGDANVFHSVRQFAACLGMLPQQHSTGSKNAAGKLSNERAYCDCVLKPNGPEP